MLWAMQDEELDIIYKKACIMYDIGNKTEAYNTYLEAAEKGHSKALNSLGSINESIGELEVALEFYDLSRKQGYELANENYDKLFKIIPKKHEVEEEAKRVLQSKMQEISYPKIAIVLYIDGYNFAIKQAMNNLYRLNGNKSEVEHQLSQIYPNDLIYIKSLVNDMT